MAEHRQAEEFLRWAMIALLLLSTPLIFLGVGFLRNGTGFQGLLNHPNAFGVYAGVLCAWLVGEFLGGERRSIWQIGIIGLCLGLLLMTESRTGGGTVALGVGLPFLFIMLFGGRQIRQRLPGVFTGRFGLTIWAGLVILVLFGTMLTTHLAHFVSKSGRYDTLDIFVLAERSRGGLVEQMLENIDRNPLFGIGFGIASEPWTMEVKRDPFFGLPLSASIEKGVMPVALVEEIGIVGFMIALGWLFALYNSASLAGFAALSVLTAGFVSNLGEYSYFSPGGLGLLTAITATWAITRRTR